MKALIASIVFSCGALSCGATVSAQSVTTDRFSAPGQSVLTPLYSLPGAGSDAVMAADDSITPTMRRQREQRAQLVDSMYPHLREEMARATPQQARRLYTAAESNALRALRASREGIR